MLKAGSGPTRAGVKRTHMRTRRQRASLLILTLVSCLRSSPEAAMLAPIAAQFEQGSYDEGHEPLYVRFADPLTASVFKHIDRSARYRIANSATPLVCPSITAPGVHGYVLTATVQPLGGDSEIGRASCRERV